MAKVLLVDDDPMQAHRRVFTIKQKHPEVDRIATASDALCRLEDAQYSAELSLVIVGLQMPGITGPQFVAELHARIPSMPILALGGPNESLAQYPVSDRVRFLPKRFDGAEMMTLARQLMEQFSGLDDMKTPSFASEDKVRGDIERQFNIAAEAVQRGSDSLGQFGSELAFHT